MSDSRPPLHPYLGLGLGLLAVSSASLLIKYALADGVPSLVIAAYRLTLATLILLPIVLWRRGAELRRLTRRDLFMVSASGAFLGAHFGTWISSLAYTTVANSVVFVSTAPLFVSLIAALFLREQLTRPVVMGMAVALMGSVIVGVSDACQPVTGCPPLSEFLRGEDFLGDMLALAGAVTVAAYLIIGRSVRARMSLLVYIFLTYGSAAVVLILSVLIGRLPPTGFTPQAFLWLMLLALVPQLIGHSSYNWALKYLPATFVSVIVLGEPIGSTVLAVLLLGERPTELKIIGGALILGGILVAAWRGAERKETAAL